MRAGWRRVLVLLTLVFAAVSACGEPTVRYVGQPQAGPPGQAGPQGPRGTTGAQGDQGAQGAAGKAAFNPVTIENCGFTQTFTAPPQRAVSLTQHTTEIMLALGLQDKMVGTAYLDDAILPKYEATYNKIPVLAEKYPSHEVLLGAEPDFVISGFASAFNRPENAGPRADLLALDIHSYLSTGACPDRTAALTMDDIYIDFLNLGKIFGIEERAEEVVSSMKHEVAAVEAKVAALEQKVKVFLYDSGEDKAYTAACCGSANIVIELAGGINLFKDLEGTYKNASWEAVVERDPEVIVLIEADWSTSAEKEQVLLTNKALADIAAVKNKRFVVVPFSSTSPGVRVPTLITTLAQAFYPDKF